MTQVSQKSKDFEEFF